MRKAITGKQAIVVLTMTNGETSYFGPFANGDDATHWAAMNCRGFDWHWQEISPVNLTEREANRRFKTDIAK